MDGRVDPPSSIHRTTFADLSRPRMGEVWVMGDPVHAALTLTERDESLYLGKLAVAPDRRGQGLARRMIDLPKGARASMANPGWSCRRGSN